jgi:hypothetical protein
MPGYGISGPEDGTGLLPWSWAVERLTASHDYWLATVWPGGRPHMTPVWGVWRDDGIWFSASNGSRKVRNLAADPLATMATDNPLEPVIVEGEVDRIVDAAAIAEFTAEANAKYDTAIPVQFFLDNATMVLRPHRAFGLLESDFAGSPTRWELTAR